jgi:hypothetical protein
LPSATGVAPRALTIVVDPRFEAGQGAVQLGHFGPQGVELSALMAAQWRVWGGVRLGDRSPAGRGGGLHLGHDGALAGMPGA